MVITVNGKRTSVFCYRHFNSFKFFCNYMHIFNFKNYSPRFGQLVGMAFNLPPSTAHIFNF